MDTLQLTKTICYHCGDKCDYNILIDDKAFCCHGCKAVYELLNETGLCSYYDLEQNPGFKIKARAQERFSYLDNEEIAQILLDFNEGNIAKIRLYIPKIHCSSCIWLLENLYKLAPGILSSRVHFLNKEIEISFQKGQLSLRQVVELLDSFGYTPDISLENYTKRLTKKQDNQLLYKIGVAGFCSGNIMLLSFPEYFGLDSLHERSFTSLFGYLNLFLAIPVLFYAASDYFISAYKGLRHAALNLDVPIALGMAAIFLRSCYEVFGHTGPGYFDSLTGLIFFLLIGKWYQSRTYHHFSFERDYQSYFPLAVFKLVLGKETSVPIHDLKKGDEIVLQHQAIVPADAVLLEGNAHIDYSFVTGEATPVYKQIGELIYAGGRQMGSSLRLRVEKEAEQSYLLQLWSKEVFRKKHDAYLSSFVLLFSRYFVYGTLLVAFLTFAYWQWYEPSRMLFAVTSVLLVACPCALALALPFALSNVLRMLGKKGFYLKNTDTVEKISEIDTIVFDKTGTLTVPNASQLEYVGENCSAKEWAYIRSAVKPSQHPLSKVLYNQLQGSCLSPNNWKELNGQGIVCGFDEVVIKIGSADFVGTKDFSENARVHVSINGKTKGYFKITNPFRAHWQELLKSLGKNYDLHLLSGDTAEMQNTLAEHFGHMYFGQKPTDKLAYIQALQANGKKVMMLGDGLNDAGALKAADVGISITENTQHFSPACDGILEGKNLYKLPAFLRTSRAGVWVIRLSLLLSLAYNAVGLYFAVKGDLTPLVAAILMPLSSVTIVLFVVFMTNWMGRRHLSTFSL